MSLSSLVDKPLMQNPLSGGSLPTALKQADPNNLIAGYTPPTGGGLESSFDSGGFKPLSGTSFDLLELSNRDSNNERQYFYNKDLNRLFNMPMGVRMSAPKGFESVTKNQYEDFANKGATLQKASVFTDAMGGGYNLDLPRLTSGPNSGQVDRTSPEFLYYYGDQQQPKLPPKLSLGSTMPTQEEGIPGASGSNIPLTSGPADPANLGSAKVGIFPFPGMDSTETATVSNPMQTGDQGLMDRLTSLEQGIGSLQNQIANLFQTQQTSDPFGLGSFMNTRRF